MALPSDQPFASRAESQGAGASRILIVDDDSALRLSLPHILNSPGRTFEDCGNVSDAIALLSKSVFDLIILDYRLPDATGLTLLDWLASEKRDEAVIIISGEDAIDAAIGALRRGADDFVRKPYHAAQLQRAVHSALHKRALETTNRAMSARLRASERLHRYLVESSPDLIFTLDANARFSYVNPRIEALLGFNRQTLIGQPFLSLVMTEDTERVQGLLQAQHRNPGSNFSIELRLRRADSTHANPSPVTVTLQGIPMINRSFGQGRYLGLYGVARDISERKRAEEIITFQAYHDQLTNLPNRVLFKDRLELAIAQAQRRGRALAVMFIDVDRFKLVNDSYGHAEGDALLRGIAARLSSTLRKGDTLARLGGDEFTVLLPDIDTAEDADFIARKILDALEEPFELNHGEFRATVSIGVSIFPRDGNTAEALTQHADIAMYRVKRSGKNAFRFFAPELDTEHRDRLSIENDLRVALDRDEFELHYQTQVSMSQRKVVGVEALLRWNHPENGQIGPDIFIPVAEEIGLIGDLSDWVLESACSQLGRWRRDGFKDLRMSLNLAPNDFDRKDIVRHVIDCIDRHHLPPSHIELEITESMMMNDSSRVAMRVKQLRDAGVGVAIDDFGTGYSALAYLQKFPVSVLKIDRSFVSELNGKTINPIVSAIMGIAKGFDLKLIAEGVEFAEQANSLNALGCDVMQGYYFARPVGAVVATGLIAHPPRMPDNNNPSWLQ